ncbi:hypothetical protein OB955_07795 [Halobacteria archaeon AArc-m2/3/4]|uniref:DUF7511 domain-containing protein n=1 Tax=Natronoglomus mannanivorans TaxID=2979990 RepID=A0AAP2YXK0_9EURY|nr:hypothetical protein [Halobacteria archaeon AArc-xg1-1]MCU4972640.1 hypothetical protein [Halobacteria archaeon AArc-m2/3/4]
MTERSNANANSSDDTTSGSPPDSDLIWHTVVERYDDEPDCCTIFPATESDTDTAADVTVDVDTLSTTWISATEGSFVSLEDAR